MSDLGPMTHAEGWTFTLDQVRAMIAELERELGERRRHYPTRTSKGDMLPSEAEYRLGILAEIRADMDVAFHPASWTVPSGLNLVEPRYPWPAKVRELERTIAVRDRHNPDRIRKGEILPDVAEAQLAALVAVRKLYAFFLFGYVPAAPIGSPAYHAEIRQRILEQQPAADNVAA